MNIIKPFFSPPPPRFLLQNVYTLFDIISNSPIVFILFVYILYILNVYMSTYCIYKMSTWECKRCGHVSSCKGNLVKHLQRKTACESLLSDCSVSECLDVLNKKEYNETTYECNLCHRKFNSRSSRYRHQNSCKHKMDVETDNTISLLKKQVEDQQKQMNMLKETVEKALASNDVKVLNTNNGTINNTTINIHVPPRNFGEENRDAIPLSFIRSTFMNLEFRELFESLHFDPQYPENHNVRIKSVKRDLLEIYHNDKWNTLTSITGMKKIIEQLYMIYDEFRKQHADAALEDMSQEEFEELENQLVEIRDWIHNTEAKLKQCAVTKEITAVLETNRGNLLTAPGDLT